MLVTARQAAEKASNMHQRRPSSATYGPVICLVAFLGSSRCHFYTAHSWVFQDAKPSARDQASLIRGTSENSWHVECKVWAHLVQKWFLKFILYFSLYMFLMYYTFIQKSTHIFSCIFFSQNLWSFLTNAMGREAIFSSRNKLDTERWILCNLT